MVEVRIDGPAEGENPDQIFRRAHLPDQLSGGAAVDFQLKLRILRKLGYIPQHGTGPGGQFRCAELLRKGLGLQGPKTRHDLRSLLLEPGQGFGRLLPDLPSHPSLGYIHFDDFLQ